MRTRTLFPMLILAAMLTVPLSGCELLDGAGAGGPQAPTMTYQQATLLKSPTTTQLLSYFCPLGDAICTPALGAAPAKEELRFDFALDFQVDNPNAFAIPTLSMLLATTLFQNDPDITELGAVCLQFCHPTDASCGGVGAADACSAGDQRDIDSLDDFLDSATDQLVGIATGELDPAYGDNLGIRTIPALGSTNLKVTFTLGVDPMLGILEHVAVDAASAWVAGQEAPLEIPYSVRGTLWVDIPLGLGRLGLPFGPQESAWQLAE